MLRWQSSIDSTCTEHIKFRNDGWTVGIFDFQIALERFLGGGR